MQLISGYATHFQVMYFILHEIKKVCFNLYVMYLKF